ncbi:proline reductase cluster protein PrdD [Senegalia massiliensis]|uniref:Proline reductase cluster protein PrdD n=1 Tax=Senegalia massiliensis TaxID=1720316 RepID=A0A845QXF0_9CLOT|nr:proline reductase cluster protein PrdD [Senegalia massiliensis]NBI07165.1 proline reductase cluster protein PrdD [Senegalia massiliensis]
MTEKIMRRLVIKSFHIRKLEFGERNSIKDNTLTINKSTLLELEQNEDLIEEIRIDIIHPDKYDKFVNSIMDIIPISTKVLGEIGEGVTHTLTGVYIMLTGIDTEGKQIAEFGSSEGILNEQMIFNKAGTPSKEDYIIHLDIILKGGIPFERKLPLTAHKVCDNFIQVFREILKVKNGRDADYSHEFHDKVKKGKKKVLIIKQIAGQGAMSDNNILSEEPNGLVGGKSIIDMENIPIILSPNEYRDGALRAMT